MYCEHKKHDGSHPIIGVNSFRNPQPRDAPQKIELSRSTEEEKQSQLKRLRDYKARHQDESGPMLARLQQAVIDNPERVRGAGGFGAVLLAQADHQCAV